MVICLERGADLHMAQLMPLPLTVSCSRKIQIGFTFLVPARPGSPGHRAVKRVCACVCAVMLCGWVGNRRSQAREEANEIVKLLYSLEEFRYAVFLRRLRPNLPNRRASAHQHISSLTSMVHCFGDRN